MDKFLREEYFDSLTASIVMCLTVLVGLFANGLMLRALIQYRKLRTDFYTVFACLSLVDSLFLVISVPAHLMDLFEMTNYVTDAWCQASEYLVSVSGFIAAYLIVVLVVLRGILLTNRNCGRRPRACHLAIVCGVLSAITVLCSIPIALMWFSDRGTCNLMDSDEWNRLSVLMGLFSEFIPLILVFIIYCTTYFLGKRYFEDSYSPKEKEKSRLVTAIVIAFVICQTPYRIFAIYYAYSETLIDFNYRLMYTIKNYLMCLLLVDKAIRPILYSKLASDLCEVFDEVINCVYCSSQYTPARETDQSAPIYHSPVDATESSTAPRKAVAATGSNNSVRASERTPSASSNESANSQAPLIHATVTDDMRIEILQD